MSETTTTTDETIVQLNVRLSCSLRASFQEACRRTRVDQNEILNRLINAYVAAGNQSHVYHIDGRLCPLDALIVNLTAAAKSLLKEGC